MASASYIASLRVAGGDAPNAVIDCVLAGDLQITYGQLGLGPGNWVGFCSPDEPLKLEVTVLYFMALDVSSLISRQTKPRIEVDWGGGWRCFQSQGSEP